MLFRTDASRRAIRRPCPAPEEEVQKRRARLRDLRRESGAARRGAEEEGGPPLGLIRARLCQHPQEALADVAGDLEEVGEEAPRRDGRGDRGNTLVDPAARPQCQRNRLVPSEAQPAQQRGDLVRVVPRHHGEGVAGEEVLGELRAGELAVENALPASVGVPPRHDAVRREPREERARRVGLPDLRGRSGPADASPCAGWGWREVTSRPRKTVSVVAARAPGRTARI